MKDILSAHEVHATFFIVARTLEQRPDVARALLTAGNEHADHSFSHPRWGILDPGYGELGRAQQEFRDTTGVCPALFRPPFGLDSPLVAHVVSAKGMRTVTWDVEVSDWNDPSASRIAQHVLDRVHSGAIILLHDGSEGRIGIDRTALVQALPMILDGLRQRGLEPVPLAQLLNTPPYLDHC